MSLINQMLKDLEDRQEDAVKGQDGIISRSKTESSSGRTPIILLSLISLALLLTIAYLLWNSRIIQTTEQPPLPTVAEMTEQSKRESSTIASLLKESAAGSPRTGATAVVVKPKRVIRAPLPKPIVAVSQPRNRVTAPPPVPRTISTTVSEPIAKTNHVAISISQLIPSELRGSWQSQKLTIMGKNFQPDNQILICWPAKCVTLKGYRVNYISPSELNITLTTGIRTERWHLTVLNPNGEASNASEFHVTGPSAAVTGSMPSQATNLVPQAPDQEVYHDSDRAISKRIIPLTAFQQAEAYYLEGKRLEQELKDSQALTLWERAVLLAPEHHASRQSLIDKLMAAARIVEAEGHIRQAIKLFPNHAVYIQKLAQIYMSQGEARRAISLIEKSIQQGVVNAELYAFVAALYQREKSSQKSIEHYQRALSLKRNSGIWWMGLGISFEQNDQFNEALSAFQQAKNSGTLSRKLRRYVEGQIELNSKRVDTPQ